MDMMNRDTFKARGVKIKQLQKQVDFLENIMEDALTTYYSDDCYYQLKQDYNTYQQEFYGIKEDRPHNDTGKARAAKTVRAKWIFCDAALYALSVVKSVNAE
jgi:hypothetical protein